MKKKYRAIIVDDERLARKDLRSLLTETGNIDIIGEADCVSAACDLINEHDPDIIFLDVQMPGESGFDLLEKIDIKSRIIFVTAYDEYAIKAFEVDAVDYLLKPVNPDRLRVAIDRIDVEESTAPASFTPLSYDATMFININNHLKFIKINSIICIQAVADYSKLFFTDGKNGLVSKSMTEWENRLPQNHFCRIHRSSIINMEFILRVEEWFNNTYRIYMKGLETPLNMSRRYASKLEGRFG